MNKNDKELLEIIIEKTNELVGINTDKGFFNELIKLEGLKKTVEFVEILEEDKESKEVFDYLNGVWGYTLHSKQHYQVEDTYRIIMEREFCTYGSFEALAEDKIENYGIDIPSHLDQYFDYEQYGKDLVYGLNGYDYQEYFEGDDELIYEVYGMN